MRIVLLGPDVNPPWVEAGRKYVLKIAETLAAEGNEVHVITTQPYSLSQSSDLAAEEMIGDIHFHRTSLNRFGTAVASLSPQHLSVFCSLLFHAGNIIRKIRPDIIHSFSSSPIYSVLPLINRRHAKQIFYTQYGESTVPFFGSPAFQFLYRFFDRISAPDLRLLEKIKKDNHNSLFVPYGIKASLIKHDNNIIPRILYVGHLYEEKGVSTLLKACALMKREFKLVIAWSSRGNLGFYERMIETLGLSAKVTILDNPVSDMDRLYSSADICVVPAHKSAHTFSTPFVILEAFACRTPVITTTAFSNIVTDKVNGLVAEPGNENDLAEKIDRLLDDKALAHSISQNALQYTKENFSESIFKKNLMEMYGD